MIECSEKSKTNRAVIIVINAILIAAIVIMMPATGYVWGGVSGAIFASTIPPAFWLAVMEVRKRL